MGTVVKIVEIRNASAYRARIDNHETPSDTQGQKGDVDAFTTKGISMWIPWCNAAGNFPGKHISVRLANSQKTGFEIWQRDAGGDRVRVSTDGAWYDPGEEIGGVAAAGPVESLAGLGDRALFISDQGVWLIPYSILSAVQDTSGLLLSSDSGARSVTTPPNPKANVVAFSMAGVPSDIFDQHRAGARFLYRDSGKRYVYTLSNGKVTVQPSVLVGSWNDASVKVPALSEAVSYNQARGGQSISPLPQFDMIAANGGRVFAKEKGTDRFFFASLDEEFIHGTPSSSEFSVPNSYLKLDPQFDPAVSVADLMKHVDGDFARHPAALRFLLFRFGMMTKSLRFMVVKVRRGIWHLINSRPPPNMAGRFSSSAFLDVLNAIGLTALANYIRQWIDILFNHHPPAGTPTYNHVKYSAWEPSIDFARVIDIGVGHVHYHQQYERRTGGEMQMLLAPPPSPYNFWRDHRSVYQLLNGPINDADGFNDGTCNFYMLAQLRDGTFKLLYIDEQSFFSQRWRLAEPLTQHSNGDYKGNFATTLTADLATSPGPGGLYNWIKENFWSPFDDGLIGDGSRLAVSAQTILVTGDLPPSLSPAPLIYSINFSWGTMDRTWRWRTLPNATCQPGDPPAATGSGTTVYPQSIRLRDDLTIHLKGTYQGMSGRWYQRYLPASNDVVPSGDSLGPGRPSSGYSHQWKFISEQAFQFADRFSHFGIYGDVDSRMLYYPTSPTADVARQFDEVAQQERNSTTPNPDDWWAVDASRLSINAYTFRIDSFRIPWPPWPPFPKASMQPASLYNPTMYLRVVKRGSRWIAMRRDKRDDDMVGFDGLPKNVVLTTKNPSRNVNGQIGSEVPLIEPPAVSSAFFWWDTPQIAAIALTPPHNNQRLGENVWRLQMAAFDNAGNVVPLLNVTTDDGLAFNDKSKVYQYRWSPSDSARQQLLTYATEKSCAQHGTSIWFEDLTGHVSPPDGIVWSKPPEYPVAQGDDMQPGEILNPDQSITSKNGRYRFIYQGDGNLVLYDGSRPLWASNTAGRPIGFCIMQGDGNLVIYSNSNEPIWSSGTWQYPGSHLVIQDDGNVVIYRPGGTGIWSTDTWLPSGPAAQGDDMQPGQVLNPNQSITSANGRYSFVYQGDCNLVLYGPGGHLWASNTAGKPVGICIMQGDGNLVIYIRDKGLTPIWSSKTPQHPGSALWAQDDGNVVIYSPSGTALWATNTMQP